LKKRIFILIISFILIFINISNIFSEDYIDYLIIYGGKNIEDTSSLKEFKEEEGFKVKVVNC